MRHASALQSRRVSSRGLLHAYVKPRTRPVPGAASAEGRARIMEVALPLFVERGYHATPVRDVADALEVSVGTIFNYFASKDDLLDSIAVEHLARMASVLRDLERRLARGGPAVDLFAEVFRRYAEAMMPFAAFFRLIAQEEKSLSAKRRAAWLGNEDRAARLLIAAARPAVEENAFDRRALDFKSRSLIALVRFWSDRERLAEAGPAPIDRLEELALATMRGEGSPRPRRRSAILRGPSISLMPYAPLAL